jgi:hypothetical protein
MPSALEVLNKDANNKKSSRIPRSQSEHETPFEDPEEPTQVKQRHHE